MVDLSFVTNFYFPQNILDILNQSLFGLTIIDSWLFLHFFSGFFLFIIFRNRFKKKDIIRNIVIILIAYEVFEFFLIQQELGLTEPLLNAIFDILVGYWGAIIARNNIKSFF